MRKMVGQELSIVGWVEGPLALAAELRGLNALMTIAGAKCPRSLRQPISGR